MVTIDFSTNTYDEILAKAANMLANDKLPEWERDIWTFIAAFLNPKQNTFSIFTSGSTGKPKLIKHTRQQLIASASATIQFFSLQQGQHALLALPVAHIGGRMMLVRAAIAKMKLSYITVSSKPLNGITMKDHFDFAALTPMQLANTLNDDATRKKLPNISTIILGGGEVSTVLASKINALPSKIYHTYGMTETCSHVAVRALNGESITESFEALPNINFSKDERGCLVIHAPALLHAEIVTNDIVELIHPHSFVWKGRWDNVINSGGVKIQAETVEKQLASYIPHRFFIAPQKDEVLGEKVLLVIESAPFDAQQLKVLKQNIHQALNKYEHPKELLFTYKFRETEGGKVLRNESMLIAEKRIQL